MKTFGMWVAAALLVACSSSSSSNGGSSGGSTSSSGSSSSSGTGSSTSSSSGTGSSSGQTQCNGDWTLGEVPTVSGDPKTIGAACDGNVPSNCFDGLFIKFATGTCTCLAKCSSFQNVNVGDSCTTDGSWKCLKIKATNADANSATACVPASANLCTAP